MQEVEGGVLDGAVLVTGARGFMGRNVTKLLQRSGYDVVALDINAAPAQGRTEEEVRMDITDAGPLRGLFQTRRIAGIIHLAAILPTAAQRNPVLATRVNVVGSLNVLEMAREFGVRRVVFGSSLSIYGTHAIDHVVSEMDGAAPEDIYAAAKLYVEQMGRAYKEQFEMEFVSLRIGRVVGPGAQSSTSAWRSQIFESLSANGATDIELPYAESERILLVHVEDVATMLVRLLEVSHPAHSIYNACCEAVVVGELKRQVESLNPNVRVKLGGATVVGNPRALDCSRFAKEFGWQMPPVFEQLRRSRAGRTPDSREDAGATQ